jgi:hypothetical protein
MKVRAKTIVHDHIVDEFDHAELTPGKTYTVFEIDEECYRVLNDRDEPILYPKALFDIVDASIPDGWIKQTFEDGVYFVGPPELSAVGFYEAYFDGKPGALGKFELERKKAESW